MTLTKRPIVRALMAVVALLASATAGLLSRPSPVAAGTTASQNTVSRTSLPVPPGIGTRLTLACNSPRFPNFDLTSMALTAVDAAGTHYNATIATWTFDLLYRSDRGAVIAFDIRHTQESGIHLTFTATAMCRGTLQRQNAKPQLLDSYRTVL